MPGPFFHSAVRRIQRSVVALFFCPTEFVRAPISAILFSVTPDLFRGPPFREHSGSKGRRSLFTRRRGGAKMKRATRLFGVKELLTPTRCGRRASVRNGLLAQDLCAFARTIASSGRTGERANGYLRVIARVAVIPCYTRIIGTPGSAVNEVRPSFRESHLDGSRFPLAPK